MNSDDNAIMKNVNETIDTFFSTNQETVEKHRIYLDKSNLDGEASTIEAAFKNIPGVLEVTVNSHDASVEIISEKNQEVFTEILRECGLPVIATDQENERVG